MSPLPSISLGLSASPSPRRCCPLGIALVMMTALVTDVAAPAAESDSDERALPPQPPKQIAIRELASTIASERSAKRLLGLESTIAAFDPTDQSCIALYSSHSARMTTLQRRGHRGGWDSILAISLVRGDCPLLRKRRPDVVEALQQPAADLMVDLDRDFTPGEVDLLGVQVDRALPCVRKRVTVLLGEHNRQEPDLRAV